MKKFITRAAKLLIIIAGLFLNAHMIIPHDHHGAGQMNGCPASDHKSELPFFPAHCNAFNDLAADKFFTDLIRKSIQTGSTFLMNLTVSNPPYKQGSSPVIIENGLTCYSYLSCSSALLRAPPSVL